MKQKTLKLLLIQFLFWGIFTTQVKAVDNCGDVVDSASECSCAANGNAVDTLVQDSSYCCGYYGNGNCKVFEDENEYGCGEYSNSPTVPDGASCNCDGAQWESFDQWSFIWKDRAVCCGWVQDNDVVDQCLRANPSETTALCGETYAPGTKECVCGAGAGRDIPMDDGSYCCGWKRDGKCENTDVAINDIEVTDDTLNELNPISVGGGDGDLSTPGGIISKALGGFIFPIAGIILFIQLLLGGFQMLTGATNSKSLDEGKQKITAAIMGFILLFAAYWIAQLLELIFGIRILS